MPLLILSKMYYIIYKTTNLVNSKFYIGKHKTSNLEDGYLGSGLNLQRAIKKYGIENFKRDIIYFCGTEKLLNLKEKELITESILKNPNCYNIMYGGQGGWQYVCESNKGKTKETSESHLRQSVKILGDKNPSKREDVRLKISNANKGINNAMFGMSGEKSPVSKLSNHERLTIIIQRESGLSLSQLYKLWGHKVSNSLIKKICQFRQQNINKMCQYQAPFIVFNKGV